jgi:RHS repeat-associated protein
VADPSTGLTNLGAREYNPAEGAFISPDPLLVPYNPQDLNPYAYASDNPSTNEDPSGAMLCNGDVCGSLQYFEAHPSAGDSSGSGRVIGNSDGTIPSGFPPVGGTPPTCPESESCYHPSPLFRSLPKSSREEVTRLELITFASAAVNDGYGVSSFLLQHFLQASGKPVYLSQATVQTLYLIPSVRALLDAEAVNSMKAAIARGNDLFAPSAWVRGTVGTGAIGSADSASPFGSSAGSQQDWHLAVKDFDYRVEGNITGNNQMRFRFEISKYYDFDGANFRAMGVNIPGQNLEDLQGAGLARGYWVIGVSSWMTVPAGAGG